MKNLFILFSFILTFTACSPIKITNSKIIKQGIEGYVYKYTGNQMPSPNHPLPKPQPLSTTIYIYENTNLKDVEIAQNSSSYSTIKTKLVKTVISDTLGYFLVELPSGKYSLFIKWNGFYYANLFDTENNIAPFIVEQNKITKITIKADVNTTY
jgi:hypothetical protein